jgi:hypothetical protein
MLLSGHDTLESYSGIRALADFIHDVAKYQQCLWIYSVRLRTANKLSGAVAGEW